MRPIHHHHGHFHEKSEHRPGGERRFAHGPFGRHGKKGDDRHAHGGRLARMLEHGDLRLLVLHLINEKPRHGYEIIKAIEDLADGGYAPSPGVIYPTLTLLEEIGQVSSTTEGARKSFTITPAGAEALTASQDAVKTILARIAANQPREAGLPVQRAMENLRTSLRLKLGTGPLSAESTRKIAETLDAAAKAIEES